MLNKAFLDACKKSNVLYRNFLLCEEVMMRWMLVKEGHFDVVPFPFLWWLSQYKDDFKFQVTVTVSHTFGSIVIDSQLMV